MWEQLAGRELEAAQCALDGLGTPSIAQRLGVSPREAARLLARAYDRLGVSSRAELRARAAEQLWEEMLPRIRRFVDRHGHSRVPPDYHDEDGLLGAFVDSLRRARRDDGRSATFDRVDFVVDLEALEGWEW